MIFEESRYETASIVPIADNKGVYRSTIIPRRPPIPPVDYTVHQVVWGDSLDKLAHQAYGDAEFWWRIADANPDLTFPDELPVGALIKVPRVAVDF